MNFEPDIGVVDAQDPALKPYMRLWAAVMRMGISDFCTARTRKGVERTSIHFWFWSDEIRTGSFCWICELFDIDPKRARSRVMSNWRAYVDRTKTKEHAHG